MTIISGVTIIVGASRRPILIFGVLLFLFTMFLAYNIDEQKHPKCISYLGTAEARLVWGDPQISFTDMGFGNVELTYSNTLDNTDIQYIFHRFPDSTLKIHIYQHIHHLQFGFLRSETQNSFSKTKGIFFAHDSTQKYIQQHLCVTPIQIQK
jgi:hypothetical protein